MQNKLTSNQLPRNSRNQQTWIPIWFLSCLSKAAFMPPWTEPWAPIWGTWNPPEKDQNKLGSGHSASYTPSSSPLGYSPGYYPSQTSIGCYGWLEPWNPGWL